jgi:hypothetical protein
MTSLAPRTRRADGSAERAAGIVPLHRDHDARDAARVTLQELRVEMLLPTDAATHAALQRLAAR